MKRSEINRALREMEGMLAKYRFSLPPFCRFSPEEWANKGHEYDEIRHNMLGWDITDYGLGDFDRVGFSLITLRNGNLARQDLYPKPYAEKLLYIREGQYSPNHFHWHKMEDIINRGGGTLLIRVFNSLPDEEVDRVSGVTVHLDGVVRTVPAGTPGAKEARLRYERLGARDGTALVHLRLETGRKHQIRVQLSHLGHPILYDMRYGHGERGRDIALFGAVLRLTHPTLKKEMTFTACPENPAFRPYEKEITAFLASCQPRV